MEARSTSEVEAFVMARRGHDALLRKRADRHGTASASSPSSMEAGSFTTGSQATSIQ